MATQQNLTLLPADIEVYQAKLLKSRRDIDRFVNLSDGLLFGKIGMDGFLALVPVVGEVYSGFAGLYLLILAV